MTDLIDRANDYAEKERQIAIANRVPFTLENGKPGECSNCGKFFGRLIGDECCPCIDARTKGRR
jgi:hypothetical protein